MKKKPQHIRAKESAWAKQAEAFGADKYRLTLRSRRDELHSFNYGKGKAEDGGERFLDAEELNDLIPYLSRMNAKGYDIYVTPISAESHYALLDDASPQELEQAVAEYGSPTLTLESSPDNMQAVFKMPKAQAYQGEPEKYDRDRATAVQGAINARFGDTGVGHIEQPLRMAGFANAKAEREDPETGKRPFAVLKSTDPEAVANGAASSMQSKRENAAENAAQAVETYDQVRAEGRKPTPVQPSRPKPETPADEEFLRRFNAIEKSAESLGFDDDASTIDWYASATMLRDGYSRDEIKEAITRSSPAVGNRHDNPEYYADLTTRNLESKPEAREKACEHGITRSAGLDERGMQRRQTEDRIERQEQEKRERHRDTPGPEADNGPELD